jgi:hypothetical protein
MGVRPETWVTGIFVRAARMLESSLWRPGSRCATTTKAASTSSGRLSKNICRAWTPPADVPMPGSGFRPPSGSLLPRLRKDGPHDQHRSSMVREVVRGRRIHPSTLFANPSILITGKKAPISVLFANLFPGLSRTSRTSLAEGAQLVSTCPTREVFRVLAPERSGSGRILDAGAATMR